jgi:predicted DsbA family dithiol-disulfide isomerase
MGDTKISGDYGKFMVQELQYTRPRGRPDAVKVPSGFESAKLAASQVSEDLQRKDFHSIEVSDKDEAQFPMQKLLLADSNNSMGFSIVFLALMTLATMLGLRLRRRFQPHAQIAGMDAVIPPVLHEDVLELPSQGTSGAARVAPWRPQREMRGRAVPITLRYASEGGGQFGGRKGCCWKADSYLDSMSPADAADAAAAPPPDSTGAVSIENGTSSSQAIPAVTNSIAKKVTVEIYSDIACPWCYVAEKCLAVAVDTFEQSGAEVSVRYKPCILDPSVKESGEIKETYCRRQGWGGGWLPAWGGVQQWEWWPNTFNAHQLCVYLEDIDSTNLEWSQRQKDQRSRALVQKLFELTYERDCNISTPEGAAAAFQELGYGRAEDAVKWIEQQNGRSKVIELDTYAKQSLNIKRLPHVLVSGGEESSGLNLDLGENGWTEAFMDAFQKVSG